MLIKKSTSKGFIRIIEIIIFSSILFVLLLPNFFYYSDVNEWSEVNNLIICNDLLYSIERNNIFDEVLDPFVKNLDIDTEHQKDLKLLKNITENVFPVFTDYEYEIKNVAPYKISIGCNCTQDQIRWLNKKILTPSYPTAKFEIEQANLNNLSSKYDLFIIFGKVNLSKQIIKSNIISMLEKGKGLVLIRNFSSEPDSFTKELFGIDFSGAGYSTNSLNFNNLSNPRTTRIAKRFVNNLIRINTSDGKTVLHIRDKNFKINVTETNANIENCTPATIKENQSCIISGIANITLFQIDPFNMDWIKPELEEWIDIKLSGTSNKRDYIFYDTFPQTVKKNNHTILSSGSKSGANARSVKEYSKSYENEPRVFWIYDYNKTKDDLNLLLKTGIIWASGEHYFVFNKKIPEKRNYCIHFYSGLNGNNIPFLVKLYFFH